MLFTHLKRILRLARLRLRRKAVFGWGVPQRGRRALRFFGCVCFAFNGRNKVRARKSTKTRNLGAKCRLDGVNAIASGPTDTGMLTRFTGTPENKAALVTTIPMARLGLPEELANAIVFIASGEASYITSHVLNVEGGKTH